MTLSPFVVGQTRIAFIGLGVMVSHLMPPAPVTLHLYSVYSRTSKKCAPLVELGAKEAKSPSEVAKNADIVFTMLAFPSDVRSVLLGNEEDAGVIDSLSPGSIVCDCTTSEPALAKEIVARANLKQCHALDAPVSGGDVGAKNATLSIMTGGDKEAFDVILPLLQAMGKNIKLLGAAGSGQHCKMMNQIAICSGMVGMCEALIYAHRSGLNVQDALEVISGGAAASWSLSNLAPRILNNNFEPGFFVEHFVKDLNIALSEARRLNLSLPGLALATQLYTALMALNYEKKGTQSLILALEALNGIKRS